jgi:hypothetical protein
VPICCIQIAIPALHCCRRTWFVLELSAQNQKKDFLNIHKDSSLLYFSFFSVIFLQKYKKFYSTDQTEKNQKNKGDGKVFFFEAFHLKTFLFETFQSLKKTNCAFSSATACAERGHHISQVVYACCLLWKPCLLHCCRTWHLVVCSCSSASTYVVHLHANTFCQAPVVKRPAVYCTHWVLVFGANAAVLQQLPSVPTAAAAAAAAAAAMQGSVLLSFCSSHEAAAVAEELTVCHAALG